MDIITSCENGQTPLLVDAFTSSVPRDLKPITEAYEEEFSAELRHNCQV